MCCIDCSKTYLKLELDRGVVRRYSDYVSTPSGLQYSDLVRLLSRMGFLRCMCVFMLIDITKVAEKGNAMLAAPLHLQVEGKGASPKPGQTVTIDWDGYTIGYYGRPFEARNKVWDVTAYRSPSLLANASNPCSQLRNGLVAAQTKGSAFTGDDKVTAARAVRPAGCESWAV